jgi:hypothetical protein
MGDQLFIAADVYELFTSNLHRFYARFRKLRRSITSVVVRGEKHGFSEAIDSSKEDPS